VLIKRRRRLEDGSNESENASNNEKGMEFGDFQNLILPQINFKGYNFVL